MQSLEQLQSGKLIGTKNLKLSCGLKKFPSEIFTLADTLEQLDLSGNQLSELPDNFDLLKNLKILFLSDNHFTKFPSIISKCVNLDIIGFKANEISEIEDDAFPKNLRWLILTNNRLSQIPNSIGKCHRLQKLMLAGNRLTTLPETLADCKSLELLRISANNLKEIPTWLVSLPKLAWLAFAGNPCSAHNFSSSKLPDISWDELKIEYQLGQGASGIIHKAEWITANRRPIAVKVFKGGITSDGLPIDEMLASITAGSHPNLVKVIARLSNHPESKQGLALELIPDNYENLGNPPSFETCTRDTFKEGLLFHLDSILRILMNICSAIEHLHSREIIHGDLYAHNTLVDKRNFNILFGDFGAATIYKSNSNVVENIIRIETRAFGCLMDDLLQRVYETEKVSEAYKSLMKIKLKCLENEVLARPDFANINNGLATVKKDYFD